jgi:ferredoxin--NADP+ reductase
LNIDMASPDQGGCHVAVVGSGPSGFYAAEALLQAIPGVHVDMFEALPVPYGLVRSGVAPDHPKLKEVTAVFERIASAYNFRLLANVRVGADVTVEELREFYHAVIFACGAQSEKAFGVQGEALPGSHTATAFVGWYNGHPAYTDHTFDLSHDTAVIVGQGNVAADVCRILMTPVDSLRNTDMADHALEALARSRVKHVHMIGRRGPAQASFSPRELRELIGIAGCTATADAHECVLGPSCREEIEARTNLNARKNVELFTSCASAGTPMVDRTIHFRFGWSPAVIHGPEKVRRITLQHNRLSGPPFAQFAQPDEVTCGIDCGLVLRSIGYRGVAIPGLPFDLDQGTLPHDRGRVIGEHGPVAGAYVTGWLKRGPSGIIGTNRADSIETVATLIQDWPQLSARPRPGSAAARALLALRAVRVVGFNDWQTIDAAELKRGRQLGRPRSKFSRIEQMLKLLG